MVAEVARRSLLPVQRCPLCSAAGLLTHRWEKQTGCRGLAEKWTGCKESLAGQRHSTPEKCSDVSGGLGLGQLGAGRAGPGARPPLHELFVFVLDCLLLGDTTRLGEPVRHGTMFSTEQAAGSSRRGLKLTATPSSVPPCSSAESLQEGEW